MIRPLTFLIEDHIITFVITNVITELLAAEESKINMEVDKL